MSSLLNVTVVFETYLKVIAQDPPPPPQLKAEGNSLI